MVGLTGYSLLGSLQLTEAWHLGSQTKALAHVLNSTRVGNSTKKYL